MDFFLLIVLTKTTVWSDGLTFKVLGFLGFSFLFLLLIFF